MKKTFFYTDAEMVAEMTMLAQQGKPVSQIMYDPRCQPEIKEKLEQLEQSTDRVIRKGGRHE